MQMAAKPLLCYVTDRRALETPGEMARREEVARIAHAAIGAGVDWVQIREKDLPTPALLEFVQQAVADAAGSAAKILVNDRLDVALAAGAAGIHLGGESIPVRSVVEWRAHGARVGGHGFSRAASPAKKDRALASDGTIPRDFLIGRSCHSLDEARQAERDGADYIFFGPVFATPSKAQYGPPQGVERLAEVCCSLRIPVLAIGGISLENAAECFRAGAAGIAAIRLFQESPDLPAVIRRLRQ
jgi:thiamine-phosphate pyrophosphorylase